MNMTDEERKNILMVTGNNIYHEVQASSSANGRIDP
jgi:hypothetical protein